MLLDARLLGRCLLSGSLWLVVALGICRNDWRHVVGSVVLVRRCCSCLCKLDCCSAILVRLYCGLVVVLDVHIDIALWLLDRVCIRSFCLCIRLCGRSSIVVGSFWFLHRSLVVGQFVDVCVCSIVLFYSVLACSTCRRCLFCCPCGICRSRSCFVVLWLRHWMCSFVGILLVNSHVVVVWGAACCRGFLV